MLFLCINSIFSEWHFHLALLLVYHFPNHNSTSPVSYSLLLLYMFSKTTHRKLILWFFSKKGNTSRQARFLGRFGTGWEVHTRSQRHNNECPWNAQCQVKNSHLFTLTKFFKIFKIVNRNEEEEQEEEQEEGKLYKACMKCWPLHFLSFGKS